MANVTITMHQAAIADFLHSPTQPIHRAVASRTRKVDAVSAANCPRDEGRMVNSRESDVRDEGSRLVGFVRYDVFYAIYQIKGTGIYGPKGTPITPKAAGSPAVVTNKNSKKVKVTRGGVLAFRVNGQLVFAKSVKGVKPNPFLVDALKVGAAPWPVNEH